MASDIEAIFYICGAIIWGLVNYPAQTIIILALFWWFFIKSESDEYQAALGGGYQQPDSSKYSNSRKPLDLNRTLAPSYIRAYDRLIGYIQARGGAIKSREDGRQRLSEIWGVSDVGRFFDSPYVIKVLNLQPIETAKEQIAETPEPEEKWWEEDTDEPETKILDSSFKEKSPAAVTAPASSSSEMCGHSGCSNSVNAFDFRCFTCRKRFCKTHGGSSVDCAGCS